MLDRDQLDQIRPFLESIEPMPAAFDQYYVKRLTGKRIKKGKNKCDLASQLRNDIAEFKTRTDRQVLIWTGSTEIFLEESAVHQSLAAFEKVSLPRRCTRGPRSRKAFHSSTARPTSPSIFPRSTNSRAR